MEGGGQGERDVLREVFPRTGAARVVGVTGAPGAGKSTLVDGLVAARRSAGERVAVVAVDPSSPFSGGAILGDRVRMQRHALDPGVFVRSMATRGQAGGLARATLGAIRVLDAAAWPLILVETVGAGQVEVDVAGATDTTVVVVTPGTGDSIQSVKAGVLEVADVLVVNKADHPDADRAARDLEQMLDLAPAAPAWRPPVVRTVATTGEGVAELWDRIAGHQSFLDRDGRLDARRAQRVAAEVRRLVEQAAAQTAGGRCRGAEFDAVVADVVGRRLDPLSAAERVGR